MTRPDNRNRAGGDLAAHKTPVSLWDATAAEARVDAPLDGDARAEVAIVGGGFTGLACALGLAQRGVDARVVEARGVGYGGSGRNAGLVNAGLWVPPGDIIAQLGEQHGAALVQRLAEAPARVFALIDAHQMQCEALRCATIHAAHSARGFAELRRRFEDWRRLGAPVELLDAQATADATGARGFHGGLLDRRAGTINPMGYARGLARAAVAAGAVVNTGARVNRLQRAGGKWRLDTATGAVTASKVVLATNAYSDDLWRALKRSITVIHYFQVATKPLGERAQQILPGRHGLWTTGAIMYSLRRDHCGRIIIGSMGRVIGGGAGDRGAGDGDSDGDSDSGDINRGLSARWAKRMLRRLFPALGAVELERAWHGQIGLTPDHLPRIYRLAGDLYAPMGYNGRGIGPGTVFGLALADFLAGGDESRLPLPLGELQTLTGARVKSRLYDAAFTVNQAFKNIGR